MQLLVSVRSAAEALDALEGGAGLIDVKEPSRGPLGAADYEVIEEVVRVVGGRCPVSAALGELRDWSEGSPFPVGVQYVKWGLAGFVEANGENETTSLREESTPEGSQMIAGCGPVGPRPVRKWGDHHIRNRSTESPQRDDALRRKPGVALPGNIRLSSATPPGSNPFLPALQNGPLPVLTAYADAELACSPAVMDVLAFAIAQAIPVLLIDTFAKVKGHNLLHSLTTTQLATICASCRTHGIKIALAGSLGFDEIERLLPLRPDWFAVRGAACAGEDRMQRVDRGRVARLVQLLT